MTRKLLVLTAAMALLSGPAFAIGASNGTAVPSTPSSVPATNSSCDGCSSNDSQTDQTGQTDTSQSGSAAGPITNPTTPRPAHTDTPSHVSQPPSGGGTPKG